jgi:hypothetical protein
MANRKGSRRNVRGAASVEAVVVLPVFIILFVAVLFIRDLAGSKLAADETARRCAWQYSANSCSAIPAGCEEVLKGVHRGSMDTDLSNTVNTLEGKLATGSTVKDAIKELVQTMVTDELANYLTLSLDSRKTVELNRPALFGGGTIQVLGKYRLACNIQEKNSGDLAAEVWNKIR